MSEVKLELATVIAECKKSRFNVRLYIKKKMLCRKLDKLRAYEWGY